MNIDFIENNKCKYNVVRRNFILLVFIISGIYTDPSIDAIYKTRARYIENIYNKNQISKDQDNTKSKFDIQYSTQEEINTETQIDSLNRFCESKSIIFFFFLNHLQVYTCS